MGAFFLSFFILSELSSSGLRLSALALIFLGAGGRPALAARACKSSVSGK